MESLRDHGFINFYGRFDHDDDETSIHLRNTGMQRFGTSTVPTHVTGLLLLQSRWKEAVDSLLELREGEHPDCVRARLAWLEDKDFLKALEYMPRRCVAERSIWEFWKRGRAMEDRVGALNNVSLCCHALDISLTSCFSFHGICGRCMSTHIRAISGIWLSRRGSSCPRLSH